MAAMSALNRLHRIGTAARAHGVLWLALLALTLRALVPTGYMHRHGRKRALEPHFQVLQQ